MDENKDRYIGATAAFKLDEGDSRRVVNRHIGMDQDADGSWIIWTDCVGPGDRDDREAEASIYVNQAEIGAFLTLLYELLDDPITFGHQKLLSDPPTTDAA
jgi:hypothetical protein